MARKSKESEEKPEIWQQVIFVLVRAIDSNHGPIALLLIFLFSTFCASLHFLPETDRAAWLGQLVESKKVGVTGWVLAIIQLPIYAWLRGISRKADASEIQRLNEANKKFVQMEMDFKLDPSKAESKN